MFEAVRIKDMYVGRMRLRVRLYMLAMVVCFLISNVRATDVRTRAVGHCVREFDFQRALDNETLHNQVYYWANNHDVREWQWEKTTVSPSLVQRWDITAETASRLECVAVR